MAGSNEHRARPATLEDHGLFVRMFGELGVTERAPDQETWQRDLMADCLLLEVEGEVCAYGYAQALDDVGYVRHVVVDPKSRGRGLGRTTMLELARSLRSRGCRVWRLNVAKDNAAAIGLYRSLGMQDHHATGVVRLLWDSVMELPYGQFETAEMSAHELGPIAAHFGVEEALLQRALDNPDHVALATRRGEQLAGLAVFDPARGAFPFLTDDPGAARPLLEALHPMATDRESVQLVIEDRPELVAMLMGLGAESVMEIIHLRGSLPDA